MDPITIGLLLAGTALSTGGGILSRNEQLDNAKREAAARNASLAKNEGILQGFGDQNKATFDANMAKYEPATQSAALTGAQDTRGNAVAGNIAPSDTSLPLNDASPATRGDLAKRMLTLHDASIARAKALGKLGGYSDQWINNELADKQAARDIGVTNSYAEGRKALVQPEGDLAATGSYKPPSIWGPIMQGAGSIASAAGGASLGAGLGGGAAPTGFSADGAAFFGNGTQASMGGGFGGGVWG